MSGTKRISPNFSVRLSNKDLLALRKLSLSLKRTQADVFRIFIRESGKFLPELQKLSLQHPVPPAVRPWKSLEQNSREPSHA